MWLTSPILLAEVGEPPYVAEPDGKTEAGEEKLNGTVPVAAIKARRVLRTSVRAEKLFTEEGVILAQTCLVLQQFIVTSSMQK